VQSSEPGEEMKPEFWSVGSWKKTDSWLEWMPGMSKWLGMPRMSKNGRVGWSLALSSAWSRDLEGDVVGEGVGVITLSRGTTTNLRRALSSASSGLSPSSLSGCAAC
jgi:hypothetical protein